MLSIKDTKKIEKIKSISVKNNFSISSKLPELFRLFDLNRLCSRNNMLKLKGLKVSEILSILFLFPFLMIQSVNALFKSELKDSVEAEKDTFFRLKNNESHNWRNLLYLFAKKHKKRKSSLNTVTHEKNQDIKAARKFLSKGKTKIFLIVEGNCLKRSVFPRPVVSPR
jgi:hypothetical protein